MCLDLPSSRSAKAYGPIAITDTHGTASISKSGSGASEGKRAEDWADTEFGAVGARGGYEGCVGRGKDGEVGWENITWRKRLGQKEWVWG